MSTLTDNKSDNSNTGKLDVTVVIPVYNEVASLEQLVGELHEVLEGMNRSYEVIVVDDGSTDDTAKQLAEMERNSDWLRGLYFPHNQGQSAALYAGFRVAEGDAIVVMDGDLEHDPNNIPNLLEKLWEGYDLVCGKRVKRTDAWIRRMGSRVGNAVRHSILHDNVSDATWKVFRRDFVDYLLPFNGMHRFFPPLFNSVGGRIAEAPVTHRVRIHGTSHYRTLDRLLRGIRDLFGVGWFLRRRFSREVFETIRKSIGANGQDETPGQ